MYTQTTWSGISIIDKKGVLLNHSLFFLVTHCYKNQHSLITAQFASSRPNLWQNHHHD